MDDIQFPDGFDTSDRVAFGLTAWHLLVVAAGVLLIYVLLRLPAPLAVTAPVAGVIAACSAALGWLRFGGRPLLDWAVFAARFSVAPRRGTLSLERSAAPAQPVATTGRPHEVEETQRDSRVLDLPCPQSGGPVTVGLVAAPPPRRPLRVGGAHRLTFFSMQRGCGRTALAVELACLLAAPRRASLHRTASLRVALLDLDTCNPSVAARLGLQGAPSLLDFALASPDERHVMRNLTRHASGVEVLPGVPHPTPQVWPLCASLVREVYRELDMDGFDVVISDVACGSTELTAAALTSSDDVLVVVTPTPTGVGDAYRCAELVRRLGVPVRLRYLVNRMRRGVDIREMESDLGAPVLSEIPEEAAFLEVQALNRTVGAGDTGAASALRRLAHVVRREAMAPEHR